MSCVGWDYSRSKVKDKQYKRKPHLKSYKPEINILANPGFNHLIDFEQPDQLINLSNTTGCQKKFSSYDY